jgi:hypothetical protein
MPRVKKSMPIALVAGLLLVAIGLVFYRNVERVEEREPPPDAGRTTEGKPEMAPMEPKVEPRLSIKRPPPPEPPAGPLSAAERAARIEKIKRDYEEIRAKASTDYSTAGAGFPGGLNAFLRQLALLEREKRSDFAAILPPQELEDLEMRETTAGQLVQRLLGGTAASEDQRRAVFRLQREFEDRFALTFDVTPAALLEREAERQQTQEKIRGVLGDGLFGAWLAGEGEDYAGFVAFAAKENLSTAMSLELWRAKNDFTLRRLEIAANRSLSPDQRTAAQKMAVQQTEIRLMNMIGPGALQAARGEVLRWLPRK